MAREGLAVASAYVLPGPRITDANRFGVGAARLSQDQGTWPLILAYQSETSIFALFLARLGQHIPD